MKEHSARTGRKLEFFDPYGPGARGVDQYGNPVEYTKQERPYGYSDFVQWRRPGTSGPGEHSVYSDRLITWDFAKHDALCLRHFGDRGQVWSDRAPAYIEAFLREYFGKPDLELQIIMEGCNIANGFPYWVFSYR
jgi:hypothetical protein